MYQLPDTSRIITFPDDFSTTEEGLLALGGNLHPQTLLNAYEKGIFPWFNEGDPILWWHPDPRLVLYPDKVHITRKMRTLRLRDTYTTYFNRDFAGMIKRCAAKRGKGRRGTWITPELMESFLKLHEMGYAHSVETYSADGKLVGGMYGLALGRIFFGESMFSDEPNTSKLALFALCDALIQKDFILLDCQVESEHLKSLGAETISRADFLQALKNGRTDSRDRIIF